MGWAPGDEAIVAIAKLQLSEAKRETYKLRTILNGIEHSEKGPTLLKLVDEAFTKLEEVERQLSR